MKKIDERKTNKPLDLHQVPAFAERWPTAIKWPSKEERRGIKSPKKKTLMSECGGGRVSKDEETPVRPVHRSLKIEAAKTRRRRMYCDYGVGIFVQEFWSSFSFHYKPKRAWELSCWTSKFTSPSISHSNMISIWSRKRITSYFFKTSKVSINTASEFHSSQFAIGFQWIASPIALKAISKSQHMTIDESMTSATLSHAWGGEKEEKVMQKAKCLAALKAIHIEIREKHSNSQIIT